jgi:N-acetylglucosaminyl-diphospho-decaprenol L-rhamnosyltransferase
MKKVSYLLVAYKSNDVIGDAIKSIQQQSGGFEREIVVIDNFASENCRDIVNGLAPDAKVTINTRNDGFTRGVNQATVLATGEYLFYLNPDVQLTSDCTRILINEFENDLQLAAAAPQLLNQDGSVQQSVRNFPTFATLIYQHFGLARLFPRSPRFGRWKNRYFDHQSRAFVEQPMASAFLVRHDVLDRIGAWDERFFIFFSDVDICRRIIDAGYRILFVPDAKASHELGGSTRKERSWLIYDSHRGFYRYLAKYELLGIRMLLRPVAAVILSVSAVLRVIYREAVSAVTSMKSAAL